MSYMLLIVTDSVTKVAYIKQNKWLIMAIELVTRQFNLSYKTLSMTNSDNKLCSL